MKGSPLGRYPPMEAGTRAWSGNGPPGAVGDVAKERKLLAGGDGLQYLECRIRPGINQYFFIG
jgi:hypothetical protein